MGGATANSDHVPTIAGSSWSVSSDWEKIHRSLRLSLQVSVLNSDSGSPLWKNGVMREVHREIRDFARVSSLVPWFRNFLRNLNRYLVSIETETNPLTQLIGGEVCIVACGA